jgi:hypothetical protein
MALHLEEHATKAGIVVTGIIGAVFLAMFVLTVVEKAF